MDDIFGNSGAESEEEVVQSGNESNVGSNSPSGSHASPARSNSGDESDRDKSESEEEVKNDSGSERSDASPQSDAAHSAASRSPSEASVNDAEEHDKRSEAQSNSEDEADRRSGAESDVERSDNENNRASQSDAESNRSRSERHSSVASADESSDDDDASRRDGDSKNASPRSSNDERQNSDAAQSGRDDSDSRNASPRSNNDEDNRRNSDAAQSGRDDSDDEVSKNRNAASEDEQERSDAKSDRSDDSDASVKEKKKATVSSSSSDQGSDDDDHSRKKKSHAAVIDSDENEGEQNERSSPAVVIDSNEEEDGEQKKKSSTAELSDSDNEVGTNKATAEDLFGDAADISSDEEAKKIDGDDAEGEERMPADENEEVEEPETRIDVEIPKITTDLGEEIHFVKLPNFLSVDTRPFDNETYEDEIDEDEVLDEEGRARMKLKVENTIRWKNNYDNDGNIVKDSNARLIRWSDGSMSLHLGSEIFDVHRTLLQGDHNHLFIRQGTGLQGQALFRTKVTFRPHSTDSFTHRKMTMSLADRSQKKQKIRVLPTVGKDPEAHRSEMIKKEEDRLKASIRRENKQSRMKERTHSRGLSSSYVEPDRYEEDEEDEGAISLSAIKNQYKNKDYKSKNIYSSDSESGSDIDTRKTKKLERAKHGASDEESAPKRKMARIEESDDED